MLVTSKELLLDAQKNGYAVGAFNVENMEMVQAVIAAAEELHSPVIMQTTPSTLKYADADYFYANVATAAKKANVPVVMHLDHGSSFELAMKASLDVLTTAFGRKVAILGDMGELGTDERALHYTVGEHAAEKNIDLLLCVGTLSEEIVKGAKEKNSEMNAVLFGNKEELLEKLPELLEKGDSILVKASHFMQFEKIVKALQ